MNLRRPGPRAARAVVVAALTAWLALLPMPVLAHQIGASFRSPLPLAVYVLGAAVAVGVSFALAFRTDPVTEPAVSPRIRHFPRWARAALRTLGVVAWLWIIVQVLIVGGSSDADVSSLFLWVYGWVGLALISAFAGPLWSWLDPFLSGFDLMAALARRLIGARPPGRTWPVRVGHWPAVATFGFYVWLELVVTRDGRVDHVRVTRSLDSGGLDQAAISAVRSWRFEPGRLGGTPVDVLVTVVMDFTIR